MTADCVPNASNVEILIVEDGTSSPTTLSDLLTKTGYKVRSENDGKSVLSSVQAKKPDLILLDFKLPGMDGVEVCRHLKDNAETQDIPVIFFSTLGETELKEEALDAGAIDFVNKPVDPPEVLARIRIHLNMHFLQRSHALQTEELTRHQDHLEKLIEERTEDLRNSEQRYRALFDGSFEMVYVHDLEGRFIDINDNALSMLGCTRDEIIGTNFTELLNAADLPESMDKVRTVVEQGSKEATEQKLVTRDGKTIWVEICGVRLDKKGSPWGVLGVARDITERKRAEESLMRTEAQWRSLVEHSPDHVMLLDLDYNIRFINRTVPDLTIEEVIGQSNLNFLPPETRKTATDCFEQVTKSTKVGRFETQYRTKEGDVNYFEVRVAPVIESGVVVALMSTSSDITERKQSEEEREESRHFLQTVIDGFPESMMVINMDHSIALANRSAREMTPGQDPIADTLKCHQVSHGRETPCDCNEHPCPLKRVIESKKPVTVEHVHRNAKGQEIILEMIAAPIFGEGGQVIQIIESARDITERQKAREKISASLKEKEVLLREIHHRVKNNMQIIVSMLRMHARETENEQMQSAFYDCRNRVNAMSLIHEALYQSEDLARIDSESYLTKLCRNLSQVHGASTKRIKLNVGKEDVSLGMDQGVAIGMIVSELVSNSFKHAFPKGEIGSISISLLSIGNKETELIVQDDGVGLPPEIDIQNSPSLGLHLAAITTTHELGGSIEVERDGGTRYVIRFKHKDI